MERGPLIRTLVVLGREIVVSIAEIGAAGANYPYQAREAAKAGKPLWVTEMQAEPWFREDPRLVSPANPARDLTPARFRRNIEYARRAAAVDPAVVLRQQ